MNALKCDRCPENTHSVHSGSTEGVGVEQQNKAEQVVIVEEVALVITLERRVGVQEEGAEKGETTTTRTFGGPLQVFVEQHKK